MNPIIHHRITFGPARFDQKNRGEIRIWRFTYSNFTVIPTTPPRLLCQPLVRRPVDSCLACLFGLEEYQIRPYTHLYVQETGVFFTPENRRSVRRGRFEVAAGTNRQRAGLSSLRNLITFEVGSADVGRKKLREATKARILQA